MKLTFLGTGGMLGSPVWNCECETCKSADLKNKRMRPSLLVGIDNKNILIDFGPDFHNQMMKHGIKAIDYALLTHTHTDHFGGLDHLVEAKNTQLLIPEDVYEKAFGEDPDRLAWLKQRNPLISVDKFTPFMVGEYEIDSVRLQHEKLAADGKVKHPCHGFVFRSEDFSFAYCTDYSKILEPNKLQKLDLLISDGSGMQNKGMGHVGVEGSIEVFHELKPKRMLLTHISHKQEHGMLERFLKGHKNIDVAYDGLIIETH